MKLISPGRHGCGFLLAGLLLVTAGCARLQFPLVREPCPVPAVLRDPGLQDGDLVLTRAADTLSAILAGHGSQPGPYAHAAIAVHDRNGVLRLLQMQPEGFVAATPESFFRPYAKAAVYRCRTDRQQELRAALQPLLADTGDDHPAFSMKGDSQPTSESRFSCIGLANHVYQEAGLPPPFVVTAPGPRDRWTELAQRILGANIAVMPSANALLTRTDFIMVGTWENPLINSWDLIISDAMAESLHEAILAGWEPRSLPQPRRSWHNLLASLAGWSREKRDIMQLLSLLEDYDRNVREPVRFHLRRAGASEPPAAEAIRELTLRRSAELRPRYLLPPENNGSPAPMTAAAAVAALSRYFSPLLPPGPDPDPEVVEHPSQESFRTATEMADTVRGATDWQAGTIHLAPGLTTTVRNRVLWHECMHALLYRRTGFPLPAAWHDALRSDHAVTVPAWLGEGLAAVVENASLQPDGTIFLPGVNRERCRELKSLLRVYRTPPLQLVLAKTPAHEFSSADYAVAWGLTYYLLTESRQDSRQLRDYLAACRRGFFADPERDFPGSLASSSGNDTPDLARLWFEHLSDASVTEFERLIVGEGHSLEAWEKEWQGWILRLPD